MSDTNAASASGLPVRPVTANEDSAPFWAATAEGRLLLRRCDGCESVIWYPRPFCPACGSLETSWTEASGRGTVYSFSIVHNGAGVWKQHSPFVLAYVELEEGPRLVTNIVGCEPTDVHVGQAVRVVWDDTGAGAAIYRFTPA